MARLVIRDSEGNITGYIESEEPSSYIPWERKKELMALAEKQKLQEAERAKKRIRQKPARIATGCLLWVIALTGMVLGGGNTHEVLGFSLIGVAIIGGGMCFTLVFHD
jgi:hypothetical protein